MQCFFGKLLVKIFWLTFDVVVTKKLCGCF